MQETVAPTPPGSRPVSSGLLYGLRVAVVAQAAAIVVAASFAGQGLQSGGALVETHVMVGMVAVLIAVIQIVVAVLYWRPGGGRGWPALASVGLLLVGAGQPFSAEAFGIHLPSGVTLFGLTVALLVWAWSPGATRSR